jgi:hypothetical protein
MLELIGAIVCFAAGYVVHMKWPDLHKRGPWRGSTP